MTLNHHLDARQQRVLRRLELVGRGPAAFFRDACRIMLAPGEYAAPTHLVGHAMREIESSVRDVFEPIVGYASVRKKKSEDGHVFEIEQILRCLEIPMTDAVARAWVDFAGKTNDQALNRFAHRQSLEVRRVDSTFTHAWESFQMVLDSLLSQFEDRFFVFIHELDRFLAIEVPSEADVARLQGYIIRNITTERYFFERLAHPGWLEPLRTGGVFASAPGGYWPPANYLRRMATAVPSLAVRCMLETPTSVSFWTAEEYLDAATALSPRDAGVWCREWLVRWVEDQEKIGWRTPEKIQRFVLSVVEAGNSDEAIALVSSVVSPVEGRGGALRLEVDDIGDFLRSTMPILVSSQPDAAFALAVRVFEDAMCTAGPERTEFDTIWRPSIAREHDYADELPNATTSMLRDVAVQILSTTPQRTSSIVTSLENTGIRVARRLAWYLLSRFGTHAREEVRSLIFDIDHLRESFDYGEFALALRGNLEWFDSDEIASILRVVDNGPDVDKFTERAIRWHGAPPSPSEVHEFKERWTLRFFRQVEQLLPEDHRRRYEELTQRYGVPEAGDDDDDGFEWGHRSPKSADELRELSTDDIVAFLTAWTPAHGGESREDLGQALREAVKADPARFSAEAGSFLIEDFVYVSQFLAGLDGALECARALSWAPVLALCGHVAAHVPPATDTHLEQSWGWAHQHTAWLLRNALREQLLPDECAETVFQLLSRLLSYPEARARELEPEKIGMAALSAAMNSIHGVTTDALISFARWRKDSGDTASVARAQELVQQILGSAPTPATHAAIGQRLLSLWAIDEDWTRRHLSSIFPEFDPLWTAAWAGYILGNRVFRDVFAALSEQYARAIAALHLDSKAGYREPDRHLAQHLALLYLSGEISLDEPAMTAFFLRAPGRTRGGFHWICLKTISGNLDKMTGAHWQRTRHLWNVRIDAAPLTDSGDELNWFGWLFELSPDDPKWLLRCLRRIVERDIDVGHDRAVLSRLAEFAASQPAEAFACVVALADADKDGHDVRGWGHDVERVLFAARQAGDPVLRAEVARFANRLASRGALAFRHLADTP